jgi:hypothetical protein
VDKPSLTPKENRPVSRQDQEGGRKVECTWKGRVDGRADEEALGGVASRGSYSIEDKGGDEAGGGDLGLRVA